jgi:hypothetical protein
VEHVEERNYDREERGSERWWAQSHHEVGFESLRTTRLRPRVDNEERVESAEEDVGGLEGNAHIAGACISGIRQ